MRKLMLLLATAGFVMAQEGATPATPAEPTPGTPGAKPAVPAEPHKGKAERKHKEAHGKKKGHIKHGKQNKMK